LPWLGELYERAGPSPDPSFRPIRWYSRGALWRILSEENVRYLPRSIRLHLKEDFAKELQVIKSATPEELVESDYCEGVQEELENLVAILSVSEILQ
jgi:hypothetical protein